MKTPIAFIIFNRPKETALSFASIRQARPNELFIIADGPRTEEERPLCIATRKIVEDAIDWPCTVHKNYSEVNLNCGARPSTGITWVFDHVDKAIILEDDCVAHSSFFPFAEELLERYKDDERVMHISGTSFYHEHEAPIIPESYYASFIPLIHGWATWGRAWNQYDYKMSQWLSLKGNRNFIKMFHNLSAYYRFEAKFDLNYEKKVGDSWDAQWALACMSRDGICLSPTKNLIANIGSLGGTHKTEQVATQVLGMNFTLIHPKNLKRHFEEDNFTYSYHFGVNKSLRTRVTSPLKYILSF